MTQLGSNIDALLKARAEIDEQLRQYKSTLTVLFTDVVGSTSFFERFGDTAGLAMIYRHAELAASAVQRHNGSVIKTIGDSVMAEFPDPGSAVRAAVEIERQLLELNLPLPPHERIELRIGIHTGVGFHKDNDVFGDVVNVAARITKRAGAAQILISRAVFGAISGEPDLSSQWLSKLTIDGRAEKEDVFEVVWTDAATYHDLRQRLTCPEKDPARTKRGPTAAAALFFAALLASFLGHSWRSQPSRSAPAEAPAPTVIQRPSESIRESARGSSNGADKLFANNSISASDITSKPARSAVKRANAPARPKELKAPSSEQVTKPVPVSYLDVGTFKEAAWANRAVGKLNQLGFHAVCVHKGHLWMKAYHVQVGPYTDPKEMEAARQRLATQGFKTHAVKYRSTISPEPSLTTPA